MTIDGLKKRLKALVFDSRFAAESRRIKYEKEIFEGISLLRNMVSLGAGRQYGSDYVVSELAARGGSLEPVYAAFLSLLRLNKKEEAAEAFFEAVGTPLAREYASLLLKWDELAPAELSEILISHQKAIKEARTTEQKRRDELVSDLIYLPVVVNVMLIFVNFIYVGYYVQQKELFQMIF